MNHRFLSLVAVVCMVLGLHALAQQPVKKVPQSKGSNQNRSTGAQPTHAATAKPRAAKAYREGGTYALDDVINLDGEGHKLSVRTVSSEGKDGTLSLKLAIAGDLEFLGFTYGQENSTFILVADGKTIPASRASFTDEVVATGGGGLFTHMVTDSPKGTLVLDTNQRSLLLQFRVPEEMTKAARQLELNGLTLGKKDYSLKVALQK